MLAVLLAEVARIKEEFFGTKRFQLRSFYWEWMRDVSRLRENRSILPEDDQCSDRNLEQDRPLNVHHNICSRNSC